MRASIIQLRELVFQRIHVESIEPTQAVSPEKIAGFDFDGVAFRVMLEVETITPGELGDSCVFAITLGIAIDNAQGKPTPYTLDIVALGSIEVAAKVENEKRADLAAVNGASLVYGAIRELVTTLTSRSTRGPLVLPTMDFRDYLAQAKTDIAGRLKSA